MLSSLLWLFIFIIGIIYFIKTRNDGYSVYEEFYGEKKQQKYTYDERDDYRYIYGDDEDGLDEDDEDD